MSLGRSITFSCLTITLSIIISISGCKKDSVEPAKITAPVTITPEGGTYSFPGDIKLRVPAGAVSEDKVIQLKKISSTTVAPIFEMRGVPIENLLACIEGTPDGTVFNLPVQIYLHVPLEPGEIPIVHEVDLDSMRYTPAETEIISDPDQDSLIIAVTHFSEVSAEVMKQYEDIYRECGEGLCRCGRIKVEQHDKDYLCDNGDCQVSETQVTVTFLDCPGTPTEESKMREVSEGCNPELHLTTGSSVVATGGQTRVSAQVELGCEPTEKQGVDFSLSDPSLASVIPTYAETNVDGNANTTFHAGDEEGVVTVTARSTVSYYTFSITASAGGIEETENGDLLTAELSQSTDIEIQKPDESWSGTSTFNFVSNYVVNETANYEIEFQFFVTDLGDSAGSHIDGTATATQDVNLSIGDPCWRFKDLNAPATLNLIVSGYIPPDSDTLSLAFYKDEEYSLFYEYVSCLICDPYNQNNCSEPGGYVVNLLVGNPYTGDKSIVLLQEGTYSGSYDVLHTKYSYSITFQKDESSMSHRQFSNRKPISRSGFEAARKMKNAIQSHNEMLSGLNK